MTTPKLFEAACKGTHLPDDDGSDENFVYGGPENADGPAVRTGAWIADVTYERAASQLESANNLKQIGSPYTPSMLASAASTSALKTPRQPAPHQTTEGIWGHFALELEGHNASPTVDYGTGSFIIANVSDPRPSTTTRQFHHPKCQWSRNNRRDPRL